MLDQNVITLLATALGGALGLVGGVVATYSTQVLNNKAERKKFVRGKCEEVYLLADQVKHWADNENLSWWCDYHKASDNMWPEHDYYENKRELKPIDCPIDRLMMIAMLHIPELTTKAQALKNVVDTYQGFSEYFAEHGWDSFEGDVDDIMREENQKTEDAHQELKLLIKKTVLNSWGIRMNESGYLKRNILLIKRALQRNRHTIIQKERDEHIVEEDIPWNGKRL
jgi:hypothetical protein